MPSCLVTNGDDVCFTNQASMVVQQLDGLTDILREQTCMLQREHDSVEV